MLLLYNDTVDRFLFSPMSWLNALVITAEGVTSSRDFVFVMINSLCFWAFLPVAFLTFFLFLEAYLVDRCVFIEGFWLLAGIEFALLTTRSVSGFKLFPVGTFLKFGFIEMVVVSDSATQSFLFFKLWLAWELFFTPLVIKVRACLLVGTTGFDHTTSFFP